MPFSVRGMPELKQDRPFTESLDEKTYRELAHILSSLKFGSVTLIVQNGKVIQIEKNEKFRLI